MRALRDRPIRQKVSLLIGLASVAGLAFAAAAVTVYDVTTFRPRAIRDVTTLAAIVRANAIPTLQFDDPDAARENLATLRNRPEIGAAGLYRKSGALFAWYHREGGPSLLTLPPGDSGASFRGDQLMLAVPLESDGQALGWLRLQYQLPTFWQRLPQYAIMVTVVLVAVGATAVLLLAALSRTVATPLRGLVETIRRLTATRDLRLRVPKHADDEIGELTTTFNRMLDTLEDREAALEEGAVALRESEARLRLALAAASMETWAVRVGPEAEPRGEAATSTTSQGMLAELLANIHPEDRASVERAIVQALAEGEGFEVEFRTLDAGVEARFTALRGQAYVDAEGAPAQLLGVAQDITERRRLERQLVQSQKMEAIGNLAGGIAHDFNNLLTGMIGYLKFAQRALAPDSPARADIDEVERAAHRAAALTSQLLSYARRQMVVPALVDLNESIHGVEPLLGRLLGEHVKIVTDLAPSLWPARVDPGQLEQVIVNLAVNARDAMPDGGKIVIATQNATVRLHEEHGLDLEPGEFAELIVSDTGTGMAQEVIAHIFEPFFTTKPTGQGTGLGLAVCYGIVKQAGGEILVRSEVGSGTTFRVLLPRAVAPAIPVLPVREEDDMVGGSETVLLAEDDTAVRELAARTLREVGYRVLEAPDGPSASAMALEHTGAIDLLLTDVVMPGQSGGALASELRRTRPSLPVLFMSGYQEDAVVRQDVLEANAPFLAKPFTPGQLRRAARRALDAPRPAAA